MANGNGNGNGESWQSWLSKQSFTAVLVVGVLYWVATYMVLPMRDDQKDFVTSIVKTNLQHAEIAAKNADNVSTLTKAQQSQSEALSSISEVQKQMLRVQEQIRDEQRRGVWNDPKPKKAGDT